MKKVIYAADDEAHIRELLQSFLQKEGFEVRTFADGESLLAACDKQMPNLVVLDIMMPGMSGFEVCEQLRRKSSVPIIFLTARVAEEDYVKGLEIGSDDYFTKPFSPISLVMRVRAIFRRIEMEHSSKEEIVSFGDITVNMADKAAYCDGKDLALTPTEIAFLHYLMTHEGAVSRNEMLKQIWGFEQEVETRVTDDTVKRLRKKLVAAESNVQIATVWGFGFKLEMK
ncbi:MAG: response regulator transcription factor [Firmicutes bacterium]|nr:response regulator transcription factor [Bacillota bacterium]